MKTNTYKRIMTTFMCAGLLFTYFCAPIYAENLDNSDQVDVYGTTNSDKGIVRRAGGAILYDNTVIDGGIDLETIEYITMEDLNIISNKMSVLTTAPESVIITIPFQTQQNNYYCGPAAARMVLGGIGITVTQDYMAQLLGTTSSAGTPAGANISNALNTVCSGSGFRFTWQWHMNSRDTATIKSHIVEALSYGNPVMVNTYEGPGDCYLQGHNTIGSYFGHYGAVADYFDYGNEVTYTDPGYGLFPGFVMDQRATIYNLSMACGLRGYAW